MSVSCPVVFTQLNTQLLPCIIEILFISGTVNGSLKSCEGYDMMWTRHTALLRVRKTADILRA
jgi:hypothetical protein